MKAIGFYYASVQDWRVALNAVIDCDLHCADPAIDDLNPYLPTHWQEYVHQSAFRGAVDTAYPPDAPTSLRPDLRSARREQLDTELEQLRREALDLWGSQYGILNCTYAVDSIHNPDLATAIARAVNQWLSDTWLMCDQRLRGSLCVPPHLPEAAARIIDDFGANPNFVQVILPVRSAQPYGNRMYHPLFEAAARHGLVIGLQFGGAPGNAPTSVGWPSYYLEEYVGMAAAFQSQILSMIVEGLFDKFPTLKVACIESGFTWLPAFMWRIDKEWKGLRREVPWNKHLPSQYIRQHMRFTLQPVDGPPNEAHFFQIIEQIGSEDLLMFSSDYPHWHFDIPQGAIPVQLPEPLARKIMAENARHFYRLSSSEQTGSADY